MLATSDVADRFHGFLAPVMLEVLVILFVSPRMSKAVRERTWAVLEDWHGHDPRGTIVMVWRDLNAIGGIGLAHLGTPPRGVSRVRWNVVDPALEVTRRSSNLSCILPFFSCVSRS
jgi:CRISPR-associated protein Cas2